MKAKCNNCDHCFTMSGDTWCAKHLQYCSENGLCNDYVQKKSGYRLFWLIVACVCLVIFIKFLL